MNAQPGSPLSDDIVFERTKIGQSELISPSALLSATQRKLLSVVTGYTPLRTLVDLAGADCCTPASIETLLRMGFITEQQWDMKGMMRLAGAGA